MYKKKCDYVGPMVINGTIYVVKSDAWPSTKQRIGLTTGLLILKSVLNNYTTFKYI